MDQLRPKAASLSIREMARDPKLGLKAYALAAETGMKLQHILYSTQDLHTLKNWIEEGVIKDTLLDVIFVLGQLMKKLLQTSFGTKFIAINNYP